MNSMTDARREIGLELRGLVEEFEQEDEAAFRRTRIACWIVTAVVTAFGLILLLMGSDWRYLALFWATVIGAVWGSHALSSRRQQRQTSRLRALANRYLEPRPEEARRLP